MKILPVLIAAIAMAGCTAPKSQSLVINSGNARFEITPNGYIRASPLDAPTAEDSSDSIVIDGAAVNAFRIDASKAQVTGAGGDQRILIVSQHQAVERTLTFETNRQFPGMLMETATYKNIGAAPWRVDQVTTQRRRFTSSPLWAFHGASEKWGQDDVYALSTGFSRTNKLGESQADGIGGGIPVAAFWSRNSAIAVGHLDTLPLTLTMPVQVPPDGHPTVEMKFTPALTLQPGESYSTPRTFLLVYAGDYFEALRTYSLALQNRGWRLPKPSDSSYDVSWCGWGYLEDVTPAQMAGIIPKLKEYNIKMATLDDRWFDAYGDWNPRPDTFPDGAMKRLTAEYHRFGIRVQLWWLPLGVEMHGPKYEGHAYTDSQVVRDHPDWLILDKQGKVALMTRQLATLCPAVPEVRAYYQHLTEKFIRDWDFDGHKLDNIFSVPACYNPKHHHKSPYDSVTAMGDVYKVIFETTRALKPDSVTQVCPCGTPPNIGWLAYMDQPVTADPVGSAQVRRRIKMYKALLGSQAPVYGDHVELTEVTTRDGKEIDSGRDFASSVGLGAVVGTKFVWPQKDAKYQDVVLTPDKDREWKKWIGLYHSKMLSRGTFRNLYITGFDKPEGYAIDKNCKTYYAFFAGATTEAWKGDVELRGLTPGKYRVFDYVNDRDLGVVDAANPHLAAAFTGSLLLEVSRIGT